jgi:hypothetical protein
MPDKEDILDRGVRVSSTEYIELHKRLRMIDFLIKGQPKNHEPSTTN